MKKNYWDMTISELAEEDGDGGLYSTYGTGTSIPLDEPTRQYYYLSALGRQLDSIEKKLDHITNPTLN